MNGKILLGIVATGLAYLFLMKDDDKTTVSGLGGVKNDKKEEMKAFIRVVRRYPNSNTFLWQEIDPDNRDILGIYNYKKSEKKLSKFFQEKENGEYKYSPIGMSYKRQILDYGVSDKNEEEVDRMIEKKTTWLTKATAIKKTSKKNKS